MENYSPAPINKPKEGIPLEFVLNKISKDFICPICLNLVWDIVDCTQCGSLFCRNCIKNSLAKVKDCCPICRKSPFTYSDCKALKKLFIGIQLKCPNKPCNEKILYHEYVSHLEKCKFRKYHCSNDGCDYENTLNNKKDMEKHSLECKNGIIPCIYCGIKIKKIDLDSHIKTKCTQLVKCKFCDKTMKRGYFSSMHDNGADNDVQCLKNKIKYVSAKFKESLEILKKWKSSYINSFVNLKIEHIYEIAKYKEKVNELENKCISLSNENEKLNEELFKWNNNFQNLHNNSLLNKKRKRTNDTE